MSGKVVIAGVAVVVVCAAAGLGVLVFGGTDRDENPGDNSHVATGREPADRTDRTGGSDDEPPPPRTPEPTPAPPPAEGAPWVSIENAPVRLALMDWGATGRRLAELVPLLADVGNAASRFGFVEEAQDLRISELRGELSASPGLLEPLTGDVVPDEVLTRPAFAVNAIAATLHARQMGLSVEQLASLTEVANQAHAQETRAVARAGPHAWRLLRLADAYERRAPFFESFEEVLTARQRRGLHADVARDRVGLDPLSAAGVWAGVTQVELLGDTESMGAATAQRLLMGVDLPDADTDKAHAHLKQRLMEVSPDLLRRPGRAIDELGYVRGAEATIWARWDVEVIVEFVEAIARGRLGPVMPDILPECIVPVWDSQR